MNEHLDKHIDVLVLSAGKGERLKTLFPNTPKILIEYKGKKAFESVIYPFRDSEKYKIYFNIRSDETQYFKNFKFELFIEDIPVGNAGAIKLFGRNLSNPFFVSHNDISLPDLDVIKLYMAHLQNDSFMTMTVSNLAKEKERGIVIKQYNKVLGFTRDRWTNCGLYCVSHKIFDCIGNGFQDIDNDLLPKLSSIHQLSCYEHGGAYEDWGR